MIRLLGLDQEAAVPQGAFQFIMLHTAQNKKHQSNLPLCSLQSLSVLLKAL